MYGIVAIAANGDPSAFIIETIPSSLTMVDVLRLVAATKTVWLEDGAEPVPDEESPALV